MPAKPHEWQTRFKEAYGVEIGPWERERFLAHCIIQGDCWCWKGPAMWAIEGSRYDPLRIAFLFFKGPLTKQQAVGASCAKACCFPDHLYCFTGSSAKFAAR